MRLDRKETATDGMALVIVLWLLGTVAAFAAVAARLAVAQNSGATLELERVHAQFAMTSALDDAAWQLITAPPKDGRGAASATVGQSVATISFENEMARIDINQASQPLLEGLFISAGASATLAGRLAAAVVDWRDPDDDVTAGGAERLDYGPNGPQPRNGPFVDPAEIGLVRGVTPAIAASVQPMITVLSGSARIDPKIASRPVMLALPGATPLKLSAYADALKHGGPPADALALLGDLTDYVGDSSSSVWRLNIEVKTRGATALRYEASMQAEPRIGTPYGIFRFSEGATFREPDAPTGRSAAAGGR